MRRSHTHSVVEPPWNPTRVPCPWEGGKKQPLVNKCLDPTSYTTLIGPWLLRGSFFFHIQIVHFLHSQYTVHFRPHSLSTLSFNGRIKDFFRATAACSSRRVWIIGFLMSAQLGTPLCLSHLSRVDQHQAHLRVHQSCRRKWFLECRSFTAVDLRPSQNFNLNENRWHNDPEEQAAFQVLIEAACGMFMCLHVCLSVYFLPRIHPLPMQTLMQKSLSH